MLDTLVRYTKYNCISLQAAFVNKFSDEYGVIWIYSNPDILPPMKKRIIAQGLPPNEELNTCWLDLEALADVEVTSEAIGYPIEGALLSNKGRVESGQTRHPNHSPTF
jgi:hypothetical protein